MENTTYFECNGELPVLKVILGGDANAGKTSLIQRFCRDNFDPKRKMTVGVDFYSCDVQIEGRSVRLSVWDLGGQERFACMRQGFYRGAHVVGLLFDVSRRVSFYNLPRWWRELRRRRMQIDMRSCEPVRAQCIGSATARDFG